MRILLGSKNPSKERTLWLALEKLQIIDYEIIPYDVDSKTNSKPIGYEIIRGLENRNCGLKDIAIQNNITYDYLCSIEGGFTLDENGLPFVVTYCLLEDKNGKKSTGKSLGIRVSKTMFDFVKHGGSLNKVIESLNGNENNKQKSGITGYLTNGLYNRDSMDSDAVVSSFISFIYKDRRDNLNKEIKLLERIKKFNG